MQFENITTSLENGILVITINREDKMNALNLGLLSELNTLFESLENDDEVKATIITGKGDKAFAAGADIAEFASFDAEEGKAMSQDGHAVLNKIENCSKPVVAAIKGFALGGGCELAMACHIRIAADNARFGQPEVKLGIVPGYGGTQRMVQLIGKGRALELMMTGGMISAHDALSFGLVNKITDVETLIDECKSLIDKILANAPLAVSKVIECANAVFAPGKNGYETEINAFGTCFNSRDFKEGTSAFVEKRIPAFSGN